MRRSVGRAGLVVLCTCAVGWGGASPSGQACELVASDWAPRGSARTARPAIAVTFTSTCGSAIDVPSIRMTVDEESVSHAADGRGATVTVSYTPQVPLVDDADHTVSVQVRDDKGTTAEKTWTFYLPDAYGR